MIVTLQYAEYKIKPMSQFKYHNLSKSAERLNKEIVDSASPWEENSDEERQKMEKVKRRWRRQQHQEFNKLQHQQTEKRSIKTLISGVITLGIIIIAFPFIPKLWLVTVESVKEFLPKESASSNQKRGFLDRLKELQEKYNPKEKSPAKATLEDQLHESLDNIDQYNKNLKKAIDLSDGKKINFENKEIDTPSENP